jgi:hypothetical protein
MTTKKPMVTPGRVWIAASLFLGGGFGQIAAEAELL